MAQTFGLLVHTPKISPIPAQGEAHIFALRMRTFTPAFCIGLSRPKVWTIPAQGEAQTFGLRTRTFTPAFWTPFSTPKVSTMPAQGEALGQAKHKIHFAL